MSSVKKIRVGPYRVVRPEASHDSERYVLASRVKKHMRGVSGMAPPAADLDEDVRVSRRPPVPGERRRPLPSADEDDLE